MVVTGRLAHLLTHAPFPSKAGSVHVATGVVGLGEVLVGHAEVVGLIGRADVLLQVRLLTRGHERLGHAGALILPLVVAAQGEGEWRLLRNVARERAGSGGRSLERIGAGRAEVTARANVLHELTALLLHGRQTVRQTPALGRWVGERCAGGRDVVVVARGNRVGRAETSRTRRELRLLRRWHERARDAVRSRACRAASGEDARVDHGRSVPRARQHDRRLGGLVARDGASARRRGRVARRWVVAGSALRSGRARVLRQLLGVRGNHGQADREAAPLGAGRRRAGCRHGLATAGDEGVRSAVPAGARPELGLLRGRDERARKTVGAPRTRESTQGRSSDR